MKMVFNEMLTEIDDDICYFDFGNLHLAMLGYAGSDWVLINTGDHSDIGNLTKAAEMRHGAENPPSCIILTGIDDKYVGGLAEVINYWKVPVYAHVNSCPFLIEAAEHLRTLPHDYSIPCLEGWEWSSAIDDEAAHIKLIRKSDQLVLFST